MIVATKTVCLLLLIGFPLFTFCAFTHSCMCGHLQHSEPPMLVVHWGLDALLGTLFVGAAYFARQSFIIHKNVFAALLGLLYVDHVLLANGAGYLYIVFDFPIMLLIAWRCLVRYRWARVYANAV